MRAKLVAAVLLVGIWAAYHPVTAQEPTEGPVTAKAAHAKGLMLGSGKLKEAEAKGSIGEPHYGYVGDIGIFEATTKAPAGEESLAVFVVHHHPHQHQVALGQTKLKYVGAKRLGNVDGWVFQTDWDGKYYPSKVFLSAEPVYFGGGTVRYIAADYRTDTGWAWKYVPLRRMAVVGANVPAAGASR